MSAFYQGMLVGSLVGSGVGGHVLRLVMLGRPTEGLTSRYYIAGAGVLLYSLAALLTAVGAQSGLYLTIFGPVVGVSAVLITRSAVDSFQLALGVFQVLSAVLAGVIWWMT